MSKGIRVTYIRKLPGMEDESADALLFASTSKFSDDELVDMVKDPQVRKYFPEKKPIMAVRYFKESYDPQKHQSEWRVIVSAFRFHTFPIQNQTDMVSVAYEPAAGKDPKVVHYKELLDNCIELYRLQGCQGCPKKGRQCAEQNLGKRPWWLTFQFGRAHDEWCAGLTEPGNILTLRKEEDDYALCPESIQKLEADLSKSPPRGARFMSPNKTRPEAVSPTAPPLRPARDHWMFPAEDSEK